MKIAVVGSGGRESALLWKLKQELEANQVVAFSNNPLEKPHFSCNPSDHTTVLKGCKELGIDLVIIGPEQYLAEGLADFLRAHGIKVFGHSKHATQLESSKAWSKQFMQRHGVATANATISADTQPILSLIEETRGELVIKYDGLAAGKGVFVCHSISEAKQALFHIKKTYGKDAVIVCEELLKGEELSLLCFCDGKTLLPLTPARDYKRAFEEDLGPNTGGMGAFCPHPNWTPSLDKEIQEQICQPSLQGISKDKLDVCGIIYFGIMLTAEGPKLLEYNMRFGDPETQVVLPSLETSFVKLLDMCTNQQLHQMHVEYRKGYTLSIVLASDGYPGSYETGYPVTGLERLSPSTLVFLAGAKNTPEGCVTAGGRVCHLVTHAESLESAAEQAYVEAEKIHFEGKFLRKDIGLCNTSPLL